MLLLRILQYSQKNTCVGVLKRDTNAGVFSVNIAVFFRARILKTSVKFLFLTIIRAAFGTLLNIYDGASNNNFHTKKLLVDV